jgi:hypothetical protein
VVTVVGTIAPTPDVHCGLPQVDPVPGQPGQRARSWSGRRSGLRIFNGLALLRRRLVEVKENNSPNGPGDRALRRQKSNR